MSGDLDLIPATPTPRAITRSPWLLLSLTTLLLLGCGPKRPGTPTGGEAEDLKGLLARADALASDELFVEAAVLLRSRRDAIPPAERGKLLLATARFYHRGNVPDLALKFAESARAAGAGEPELLYIEGDSRRILCMPGAEEALEKLLAIDAGNHLASLSLARSRLRTSGPSAALPLFEVYFKRASPSEPEYKAALLEEGRALRAAGRHQDAADRFARLLEEDPLESQPYSELAATLYRMKLRKEARFIEEIYRAISQNAFEEHVEDRLLETGATAFALGQRAINRTREHRFLEAFRSHERACRSSPADPRLRIHHADLCLRFARIHDAHATLDEGYRRGGRPSSGLLWMKGRAHLEEEKPADALRVFREGLRDLEGEGEQGGYEKGQAPPFPLLLGLARAALEAGNPEAAAEAAARAEAASPGAWEPSYWLGRVELARGEPAKALVMLEEATRRGGGVFADVALHAASALEAAGRKEEAVDRLRQVTASSPGHLPAREALARLSAPDDALERLRGLHAEIQALKRAIDALPLEECGERCLALGKLLAAVKDPAAFDFVFLASDLLPRNAEAARILVSAMKRPQDVFVRLKYLRRLLEIEPGNAAALAGLVEIYRQLHIRPGEADRLSRRLEGSPPPAVR